MAIEAPAWVGQRPVKSRRTMARTISKTTSRGRLDVRLMMRLA
jgi:hypothetical protein